MAHTLHADGTSGKVYIYNNASAPSIYAVPTSAQLGDLNFHSALSYLGNSVVVEATVTHPVRTRSSYETKGLFSSTTHYDPVQGTSTYNLGNNSLGANAPFVPFYGTAQVPSGTVIHQVGESVRAVSIYVTATKVKIYESWATFDQSLPAITRTYKVYLFNTLFTGSGNTSLAITGNSFTAGFGKLSSSYRYLRDSASPDFYVTQGKTADVSGGGLKVVLPDGSVQYNSSNYTGSFAGTSGRGVEI